MKASNALASTTEVQAFIHEYFGAWGTDEERIMSYFAEHVVLQLPGTLLNGKEAVREQFVRPFITAFPGAPDSKAEVGDLAFKNLRFRRKGAKLCSWQRLLVYKRSPSENCLKIKPKIQQEFLGITERT